MDESKIDKILQEVILKSSRSSGPGGQHVNTTESKISLEWKFSESLVLTEKQKRLIKKNLKPYLNKSLTSVQMNCSKHRSQSQNKEACIKLFTQTLKARALYEKPPRRKTKPTKGSVERRLKNKKSRSDIKKNRSKIDF